MSFDHRDPGTPESEWAPVLRDTAALRLEGVDRAVVFAAHPDDETLGAAGTVHRLVRAGAHVRVLVASLGEASHPDSPTHSPEQLQRIRRDETIAAVAEFSDGTVTPQFLGLPDGALSVDQLHPAVSEALDWLAQGRDPLALVTWEDDGHRDHEALGHAVVPAAAARGIRCARYPVWWWHWGDPEGTPHGLVCVALDETQRVLKRAALEHHVTQVRALSEQPGDEVLLGAHVLAHFDRDAEYFVLAAPNQAVVFDRVHRERADPWEVDTSPYEARKRDVLLASLPRDRYARGLDVGCSTGALSVHLAHRVGELHAVDASDVALSRARARSGAEVVHWHRAVLPEQWDARWRGLDLVVLSEVGYFCSPRQWERLLDLCARALTPGGDLVLCHWRHPVVDWPLDGADVHAAARATSGFRPLVRHTETDFELDVLRREDRS